MSLGDVLQIDFWIGLLGAVSGIILGLKYPGRLIGSVSVTAGIVGVIIGAVIAGAAIQSAFLDQSFLRKLRAINRDPVTYLTPFFFFHDHDRCLRTPGACHSVRDDDNVAPLATRFPRWLCRAVLNVVGGESAARNGDSDSIRRPAPRRT